MFRKLRNALAKLTGADLAKGESTLSMSESDSPKLAEGQIWKYQTRANEPDSLVYLVRIDQFDDSEPICHLYIDGLKMKNSHDESDYSSEISHSPISYSALSDSVTELIDSNVTDMPDISEGYSIWRAGFDKDEAGVFRLPVWEIVECLETAWLNGSQE